MAELQTQMTTNHSWSWSRVRIAATGAVLHGVLACAALVGAVRFAIRPGESCDDAGPCFALNMTRMVRLVVALPLLYLVTLVLWTTALRILLRRGTDFRGRASAVAGFQVLFASPAILLAFGYDAPAALALLITAAVVIPAAVLWWATAPTGAGRGTMPPSMPLPYADGDMGGVRSED